MTEDTRGERHEGPSAGERAAEDRPGKPPGARDLFVSWTDYHLLIERLARDVYRSGWVFDQIVCIARGGLRVGDTLSRIFKLPLAIVSTQSYTGEAGATRGSLKVAEHLTMTTPTLGRYVLLADDLVDSGATLEVVKRHVLEDYPAVMELRTAVLWYKGCSHFVPDYYVVHLPDSPWIHQPFEPYDMVRPEVLAERVKD